MIDLKKRLQELDYPVKKLGKKLWPDSSPQSQQVNASNLIHGKIKTIRLEWLPIICQELQITFEELIYGREARP